MAMEFGCLVKLGRHTTPLPIPCRRRRLCRQREVKPHIADDTALVCGKVGRRQSFIRSSKRDSFFLFLLLRGTYFSRAAFRLAKSCKSCRLFRLRRLCRSERGAPRSSRGYPEVVPKLSRGYSVIAQSRLFFLSQSELKEPKEKLDVLLTCQPLGHPATLPLSHSF